MTNGNSENNMTAMQLRLLGLVRTEPRVWSELELSEALVDDLGEASTGGAPAATVKAAVQALIEAGLAHRIGKGLVGVSRRGLLAKTDDRGGAIETSSDGTSGVGVFAVGAGEMGLLHGGAEDLSGQLLPLGERPRTVGTAGPRNKEDRPKARTR
jgi:hypothetical protein